MDRYLRLLREITFLCERNYKELGRHYALEQLRTQLNHLSNEALQELQRLREETPI